jgi:hypothetical protein
MYKRFRLDSQLLAVVLLVAASACGQPAPAPPIATPARTPLPDVTAAASAVPKQSLPPSPAAQPAVASPSPSVSAARLAAVVSPGPSPSASALTAAPRPAGASLAFTEPTAGGTVAAGSVAATVNYSGPTLVAAGNATKLDDYHIHYLIDVDATPYIGTTVAIPLSDPRIIHTAATSVTIDNVAAGPHTLTVVMTGSNHISVNPPLSDKVSFTAR